MLVSQADGYGVNDGVYAPVGPFARLRQRIRKNLEIHLTRAALHPREGLFSPTWFGAHWQKEVEQIAPSLIHLHWINYGHCSVDALAVWNRPLVWTLHDEWPYTGGCHFSQGCDRFTVECGECPQIRTRPGEDSSRYLLGQKMRAWESLPLQIVAPSQWIADRASRSALFQSRPIHVVPNGVDPMIFAPGSSVEARSVLGIPAETPVFFFPAANALTDRRKGFPLLDSALSTLSRSGQDFLLLVAGSQSKEKTPTPYPLRFLGNLSSEAEMSLAYQAADATIVPSMVDNLPNTVLESLACGTPVIAFPTGGIPEMIDHGRNGFLTKERATEALVPSLFEFLRARSSWPRFREAARQSVLSRFTIELQVNAMKALYEEILTR